MELVKYLHEKVKIKPKSGEELIGVVENMDNDFDTDSGENEITISQERKEYELEIKESEIQTITVM